MKDIRPGLFSLLAADSAVSALVTASGISRIFPIKLPQGTKLASVVFTRISGDGDYTMQGPSGYTRPRYQIGCWAPTADAAAQLANAVKDVLDGFKGAIGTGANSIVVQGIFVAGEREQYDDVVQMYGVIRDYFIHHGEL